jgi:glycosyltransferase involved in cell wall biosynthesis
LTFTRPIILCFVAYYLPGYRSGGPVRTIANFVEHLGGEFDIRIVTRDRDALDTVPYPSVKVNEWNQVGAARVFYASKKSLTLRGVARLICETKHDVLYLNSFFAIEFTCLPLLARRLGIAPLTPCVIAPRGEFSQGAIALKTVKKRIYMMGAKLLGLYSNVKWQASSEFEALDIRRELNIQPKDIFVAPNLPPVGQPAESQAGHREASLFRIVFISRISPMKNLDFLLRALKSVGSAIELGIYGPIREPDYWATCENLIADLPNQVRVKYNGELKPIEVLSVFAQYHLFVLPTRGENYGHVILESLMAGTPVLVSDQTPWRATSCGGIETLALDSVSDWASALERWASYSDEILKARRKAALEFAQTYLKSDTVVRQNRELFLSVLGG